MALVGTINIAMQATTVGLKKGLDEARGLLGGFQAEIGKINGLVAGIGLGLGAGGLVAFLADAADKGSDLGETMNKIKEVFGGSAGTIVRMSEQMAEQFGSVKQETLDAAANIGLVAQGAGLGSAAAAGLSEKLVRLADDASSFYNVPLAVALEKIRAGLIGEAEPLRAFGVLLSESAMKQEAMRLGIGTVNGELTEQEKVLARVELITRGLSKAQGDHARTMDSYANQMRRLRGEWENTKAAMGGPVAGTAATLLKLLRENPGGVAKSVFSLGMYQDFNFQDVADSAAGVNKLDLGKLGAGPSAAERKQAADMAVFERAAQAARAARLAAFERGKFNGGGFGAFGMFGNLGGMLAGKAAAGSIRAELAARGPENPLAGAMTLGSREAASTILRARSGRDAQADLAKVATNTEKQLGVLDRIAGGIDALAGKNAQLQVLASL